MEAFDWRLTWVILKGKVNLGLTSLGLYLEPGKKAGSEAGRRWVCAGSAPSDRVLLDKSVKCQEELVIFTQQPSVLIIPGRGHGEALYQSERAWIYTQEPQILTESHLFWLITPESLLRAGSSGVFLLRDSY